MGDLALLCCVGSGGGVLSVSEGWGALGLGVVSEGGVGVTECCVTARPGPTRVWKFSLFFFFFFLSTVQFRGFCADVDDVSVSHLFWWKSPVTTGLRDSGHFISVEKECCINIQLSHSGGTGFCLFCVLLKSLVRFFFLFPVWEKGKWNLKIRTVCTMFLGSSSIGASHGSSPGVEVVCFY